MAPWVEWIKDLNRPSQPGELTVPGIGIVEIEPDNIKLAESVSGRLKFKLIEMEPSSEHGIKKSRLGVAEPLE